MRKAIVRQSDGYVDNVVEVELGAPWQPPEGYYLVDAPNSGSPGNTWDGAKFITSPPSPPQMPTSDHYAIIISYTPNIEKPLKVKRIFSGYEFIFDCYISQNIKDEFLAGHINIGDIILVTFVDEDVNKALAVSKILKTW